MTKADKTMGDAISALIDATEKYVDAYALEFGQPVGHDGVLGDDGVVDILRGIYVLLSGPRGTHDGGKLSSRLHTVATRANLTDENGEF